MKIIKLTLIGLSILLIGQLHAQDTDSSRKERLKTEILKNLNDKNQYWLFDYLDIKKGWKSLSKKYYNNLEAINFDNYTLILKAKKGKIISVNLNQGLTFRPYDDKYLSKVLYIGDSLKIWTSEDPENKYSKATYRLFSSLNNLRLSEIVEKNLASFQKIATDYKALSEKPTITEEQRKYIVQANSKNEKKEYNEALELYKKAIDVNLTAYPSAYNNMALIAAQIQDYWYAILNMKKYLMLVPEAEDARAAQDKIYEWEAEINK